MKSFYKIISVLCLLTLIYSDVHSQGNKNTLLLNEMTWVEVQSYLQGNDMIIIPLGSTEQHGKHLPLGTDYFSALELSKKISKRTGVIIAPLLMVGYSDYHSGFPGTLSISTETMEQVVFECIESLMEDGFRRFLLFNGHGGNNIVQQNLIQRIAQTTRSNAVAIGYGSPVWPTDGIDKFDWHAGKFETSLDLFLFPDLVEMDKAEKPLIRLSDEAEKMRSLSKDHDELSQIWEWSMIFVPEETGKGGAVHEMSNNGVVSLNDPKEASTEIGEKYVNDIIEKAVALIEAWKLVK